MNEFDWKPKPNSQVDDLQVKIDLLKWVKSARSVVPSLPDCVVRKNLEVSIESLLNSEPDYAIQIKALQEANEKLKIDSQALEKRYSELKEIQTLPDYSQVRSRGTEISRPKWLAIGLIIGIIVGYLQSHRG